jgi:DNA-binding PadR family transcriptional regulator
MKKLSPTSYALLGLLARKSWSAYELNAHMQYSVLNAFWPRAASGVYTEPKKLVANKLARAKEEERNGRSRTVYTITAAGRKELSNWLASPTESWVSMSFEAMLKFLYSESGNLQTLNDTIDSIEEAAINEARAVLQGVKPIMEFAEQDSAGMPYNGMALNFLADVTEAQINWARKVRLALESFEDTSPGNAAREEGVKSYNHLIARLQEMVGEE